MINDPKIMKEICEKIKTIPKIVIEKAMKKADQELNEEEKEIEEALETYAKLHEDIKFTDEDYKEAIEEAKKQIEYHHNLNDICCFMTDSTTLKVLLSLIEKLQKGNEELEKQVENYMKLSASSLARGLNESIRSKEKNKTDLELLNEGWKQVIRDKIKELEEDEQEYKEKYEMWSYDLECLEDIRVMEARIEVLKELLGE